MSRPASPPIRGASAWPALLIVALALFAFWPALRGTWLWDDAPEIYQNPEVIGDGGLARIWFAPGHDDYFPLKTTIEWGAWRLWGANVVGYHALSLVLHVLSAWLAIRLFARLGIAQAWVGGVLFAVHPLAVESVAWIAELKNTIALPPLLLAMIAYLDFDRTGRRAHYGAALGWFVASLLCKTSGVMLPVVMLLYHGWKNGGISGRDGLRTAPFFLVSLGLGLVTLHFQHAQSLGAETIPIGGAASRVAVAGLALAFYLGKFLLPAPLVPVYPQWAVNPPDVIDFWPWPLLALAAAIAWRARRAWGRHVLFGLGAFGALVAPVLGFVGMSYMRYSWVADHFVYLPMLALIGLAAAGAEGLFRLPFGRFAGLALIAGLTLLSRRHAGVFRDEITLWHHTLRHNPRASVAHSNLGALLQQRDPAAARRHLEAAIAGNPADASAHTNLGVWLLAHGEAAAASEEFRSAIRLRPKLAAAHANLGNALVQLQRLDEALAAYRHAIALQPTLADAHNNLGNALFMARRPEEALAAFRAAIAANPEYATAHNNLGKTLLLLGRTAEARPHYERAVALAPDNAAFAHDLAYACIVAGQGDEARRWLEKALQLRPDFVDAHLNLGALLYQRGDLPGAQAHFEAVLRIDPQSNAARDNLRQVREKLGAPK